MRKNPPSVFQQILLPRNAEGVFNHGNRICIDRICCIHAVVFRDYAKPSVNAALRCKCVYPIFRRKLRQSFLLCCRICFCCEAPGPLRMGFPRKHSCRKTNHAHFGLHRNACVGGHLRRRKHSRSIRRQPCFNNFQLIRSCSEFRHGCRGDR